METWVETVPLTKDDYSVYRIGGARVMLDWALHQGRTEEEIVQSRGAPNLADVYQVIGPARRTG
jgi:hypothetical protein